MNKVKYILFFLIGCSALLYGKDENLRFDIALNEEKEIVITVKKDNGTDLNLDIEKDLEKIKKQLLETDVLQEKLKVEEVENG